MQHKIKKRQEQNGNRLLNLCPADTARILHFFIHFKNKNAAFDFLSFRAALYND